MKSKRWVIEKKKVKGKEFREKGYKIKRGIVKIVWREIGGRRVWWYEIIEQNMVVYLFCNKNGSQMEKREKNATRRFSKVVKRKSPSKDQYQLWTYLGNFQKHLNHTNEEIQINKSCSIVYQWERSKSENTAQHCIKRCQLPRNKLELRVLSSKGGGSVRGMN